MPLCINNCIALQTNRRLPFPAPVLARNDVLTAFASVVQTGPALALPPAFVRIVYFVKDSTTGVVDAKIRHEVCGSVLHVTSTEGQLGRAKIFAGSPTDDDCSNSSKVLSSCC